MATGQPIAVLRSNSSGVTGLGFSPDGTRLASVARDEAVRIWDLTTHQEVISLRGHTDSVRGVTFSPDGTRIASAGDDGTIRLWDARPWTAAEGPAEHEALGLLNFLIGKPLCKADVAVSTVFYHDYLPGTRTDVGICGVAARRS